MELTLSSPVQYVPRVGPKMAKKLEKLGVRTVEDLLWYAPFRYNDYSLISPIARVQPGETVTIRGEVISMKNAFTKTGKKLQQAKISDETGTLDVIWFNQMYLTNIIKPGQMLSVSGKVDWFGHTIVMTSPEYEIFKEQSLHTGRLVPVYSETEGLSSKWLRGRIAFAIDQCLGQVEEYLPLAVKTENSLPDLADAIKTIHFPKNSQAAAYARKRLAFDELFLIQLRAREQKRLWQSTKKSYPMRISSTDMNSIVASLPFELTADQRQSIKEILSDLEKPVAMNRLLEGDVGSGKTVVAAIAMYVVFQNGQRSVLMAPTEILANQHHETLSKVFTPLGLTVALITGTTSSHKVTGLHPVKAADILIGTHALMSKSVTFDTIGLIVIDEQQRFGVQQRAFLMEKGGKKKTPHLLTMTATPIPRTVARTLYGNLDLSVLNQMPKGRQIVKTWVVPQTKRTDAYSWIQKQIKDTGAQVFVVCPLIEESESLATVRAVNKEFGKLKRDVFPQLRLGLLHGRMKSKEKTTVLDQFRSRSLDILVTTPVVEVGIDVPNASIMLIEAADRFGLSQLHQLRGRVGRGSKQSYCLLFTELDDEVIIQRLKAMETIHNGPLLAELDLKLRGPGELFGTKQHGLASLRFAQFSDTALIRQTKAAVDQMFEIDPELSHHPLLRARLEKSTIQTIVD